MHSTMASNLIHTIAPSAILLRQSTVMYFTYEVMNFKGILIFSLSL